MKNPTIRFVFDRKKVATKTTKGLLQIEFQSERKRRFYSTGIKLFSNQWDDRKMVINTPDLAILNSQLLRMRQDALEWLAELSRNKEEFEFDKLERFMNTKKTGDNFIEYVERRVDERNDIKNSSKRNHRKLVHALTDFGLIKYFTDLTKKNILAFDHWLKTKGITQTTVHGYHKTMKAYINDAIRAELITENPYEGITIDRGHSKTRKYLTMEQLNLLQAAPVATDKISKVRDLFLFQCYTGLAYADVMAFDFSKVIVRNGKSVFVDTRRKTDEPFYLVLMQPALDILKKYNYELPKITNQRYNDYLKVLAAAAGLDVNLTSHMGRHTFAVLALNNGAKMENVAKMMGHTDIKTTQIYAKVLNSAVEEEFSKLESAIKVLPTPPPMFPKDDAPASTPPPAPKRKRGRPRKSI